MNPFCGQGRGFENTSCVVFVQKHSLPLCVTPVAGLNLLEKKSRFLELFFQHSEFFNFFQVMSKQIH